MTQDINKIAEQVGRVHVGELGSYRILESIGAGGMGSVALGETLESGRRVALKFLHEDLAEEGSSSRDRFEREIRVLQDLKAFRGIVQIEDYGRTDDGILFLVMEYVSAPTLDKIIEQNPQGLTQIRAVQIVTEILSVLEPIHHRKFIHRDLKPHNICVYEDPLAIRLLDFGLSKPFTEGLGYDKVTKRMQGKGSEIPGSPHYMAVEQFLRPKEVDERTDLYAVGIILYELLAGIPPFRGIYLQDILKQHKETEPPPIDSSADGGPISYRLQAVVDKALAKKQESRYQSAGEFKEALFDVLNMLNKQRRPRKTLDGRYRILRKIGQGGNSEVFEAERLEDSTRVALKIAREGASDWDEETLMNEADRALNHENIVRVHEFGEFESRPALVMELLEGGTLEDVMKQFEVDGLPENIFYRTMVDICRGLHHAHQSNIVHRDVKPGNMLRTVDGKTKVCDFGIAKRFEQSGDEIEGAKNTTLAKGTAQYISPEQCDMQGRVDRRADVYCLGVMMYEMLAGKLPFTEGILIMQHLQMDPPPLHVRGRYRNPDELCRVVERAMQKDPAKRFQSMKELAQELVRVSKLEPQEKAHKPVTLSTIPEEWVNDPSRGLAPTTRMETSGARSSPTKVIVAASVAVVAIVAVIAFMGGGDDPPPDPDGGNRGRTVAEGPTPDDLAAEEAKTLQALVNTGDWAGFQAHEIEHLMDAEASDRHRNRVLDDIGYAAGDAIGEAPADAGDVAARLAELSTIADCADRIQDGCDTARMLKAFAEKAAVLAKEPRADADGWTGFDDVTFSAAREAVAALEGAVAVRKSVWEAYIETAVHDRLAANVAATATALGRLTGDDDGVIAHLRELEKRAKPGELESVFEALKGWAARSVRAAGGVSDRFAFITTVAPKAAGAAAGHLLADVVRLRSSARRTPGNAADAVALGILEVEAADAVLDAIRDAVSLDPKSWPTARDRVEALGIPVASFLNVVASGVSRVFDAPGFADAVLAGAPDELAAKGPYADELDGYFQSLMDFANLSSADRTRAERAWNGATSSLKVGNEALARDGILGTIDDWKAKKDLSIERLTSLFGEMNRFVGSYPASDAAATVRAEAAAILDEVNGDGRFLTEIILVVRGGQLLASGAASARVTAAKAALVAALTELPDENLGIVGACNAEWAAKTDRCIVVKYLLPKAEATLFGDGGVDVVTPAGAARIDGNELVIEASPSELDLASRGTGGPLDIKIPVALSSRRHGLPDERLTITVRGPEAFDFEPPELRPRWNERPDSSGWRITADVRDSSVPDGGFATRLIVNGRAAPRRGDAAAPEWVVALSDLSKGGAADTLSIEVADAFGNATTAVADARDVQSARDDLVRAEDAALQESFRAGADSLRAKAVSAAVVKEATTWLGEGARRLGRLADYDRATASRSAGDLLRNLGGVLLSWMASDVELATLEGARADVAALVTAIRAVENDFGLDASESSRWTADYAAKIDELTKGATANGGKTGNGGNSGTIGRLPPPKKDWHLYENGKPVISAAGLELIKVDGGRDGPAWVSTVEVSKAFAQQYFPGAVRAAEGEARSKYKSLDWKDLENDMPLVPLTPEQIEKALQAMRSAAPVGGLESQTGGPVKWDVPTREQWHAAGRLQGGRTYAWGDSDAGAGPYKYRNAGDKRAGWYDGLLPVDRDPAGGRFEFLSGNAWEIVRLRFKSLRYYRIGGSMVEASGNNRVLRYLELDSAGKSQPEDASERFTGFRLALVATEK